MKCDLCGSSVKVVGHTTKHYEPDPDWREIAKELADALIGVSDFFHDNYCEDSRCNSAREALAKFSKLFADEERKGEG